MTFDCWQLTQKKRPVSEKLEGISSPALAGPDDLGLSARAERVFRLPETSSQGKSEREVELEM